MNFRKSSRPVVMGRAGIVATGHHLASLAGVKALQEGGNAVDAVLAAALMMAVVKPDASGPGGDLFALVSFSKNSGRIEALNASGPAPGKATIDFFREKRLSRIPLEGPLSIAVPGAVDGWLELHGRYGTFELSRLARDAIQCAREGFPLYPSLAERIAEIAPGCRDVERAFRAPLGELKPGRAVTQPGLADTLEQISQKGRAGFYEGKIAESFCRYIQKSGGVLELKDLEKTNAEWMDPLKSTYRNYTVYEQPPVSQGFMVLEMLNILEEYRLNDEKRDLAEVIHLMVEAKKLAFEDRIQYLEDPRFGDPKMALVISKEHARARRRLISEVPRSGAGVAQPGGSDTTYLCAIDGEGNAVSLIQSIFAAFGSRVVDAETGVVMNNRLCGFGLKPGRANALMPGKRPAHTLNSYMVSSEGKLAVIGGSPGADDQPQTNLQILYNLLDLGMDPQSAIEFPRWSHQPGTPPRAEGPEELKMEEGFPAPVIEALRARGHNVSVVDRWSFGSAKVIVRDADTGAWMAGADPRREAYAIGW
ncbi:MAG: gamma-glutamyltransferase [Deltaproteobacteria bacterium]|nr:gamma-glutamyltransferase [Deltaproteobacteria bacterium]